MKTVLLTAFSVTFLQGCVVYDESLFNGQPSAGTGGSATGGAATGGLSTSGGSDPGSGGLPSGGSPAGGMSSGGSGGAVTGGAGGAGSGGVSTGGSGVGGSGTGGGPCTFPAKPSEDLSAYVIVSIDDFSGEWRKYSNDAYTGEWYAGGDGSGAGLFPNVVDPWKYTDVDCTAGVDLALHVTGSGYTAWGVSYDATLMATGTVDASSYTGITFRARSDKANPIMLAFKDSVVTDSVNSPQKKLGDTWTRYFITFPAIDKSKFKTVSIVGLPDTAHDFMIDDVALYK